MCFSKTKQKYLQTFYLHIKHLGYSNKCYLLVLSNLLKII